jgi:hypothetical protein
MQGMNNIKTEKVSYHESFHPQIACQNILQVVTSKKVLLHCPFNKFGIAIVSRPIPVVTLSKAEACGRELAGIVGSNPTGAWMFVSCTVFVLPGRGLCDGPIPCPEEPYRLWCALECYQVKIKTLYTYYEQAGRRGKDYETKHCQ